MTCDPGLDRAAQICGKICHKERTYREQNCQSKKNERRSPTLYATWLVICDRRRSSTGGAANTTPRRDRHAQGSVRYGVASLKNPALVISARYLLAVAEFLGCTPYVPQHVILAPQTTERRCASTTEHDWLAHTTTGRRIGVRSCIATQAVLGPDRYFSRRAKTWSPDATAARPDQSHPSHCTMTGFA